MPSIPVGKAKLKIKAEGCIGCGALWSDKWNVALTVTVKAEELDKAIEVPISVCRRCARKKKRGANGVNKTKQV